jgi:hypothetical protein
MKFYLFYFLCFFYYSVYSQTPTIISSKTFLQNIEREDLTGTCWTSSGSSIHAGTAPNPTGIGGTYKYCYKIDRSGDVIWDKTFKPLGQFGDVYLQNPDSKNDSTLIGGYFTGQFNFDTTTMESQTTAGLILMLDKTGKLVKKKVLNGPETRVYKVLCGKKGDFYVYGFFKDSISIDGISIYQSMTKSCFIARLDVDFKCLWINKVEFGSQFSSVYDFCIDKMNDIVFVGNFAENVVLLDTTFILSGGDRNTFICKIGDNGSYIWRKKSTAGRATLVSIDTSDNIYVSGLFNGASLKFDVLDYPNTIGKSTLYVLKMNKEGLPIRVIPMNIDSGGSFPAFIQSLSFDYVRNQVLITGTYSSRPLEVGVITLPVTPTGRYMFAVAANQDGTFAWAKSFGNANSAFSNGQGGLDSLGNFLLSDTWYAEGLKIGCKTYNSPDSALLNPYLIKLGFCSLSIDSSQVNNPDCFGYTNGQIKAFASSREGPVTYSWGGANTGPIRSGIGSGNYRLIVSDGSCCKDTSFYSLTVPPSVPQPVLFGLDTGIIAQVNSFTCQMPDTSFHVRWEVAGGTILSGQGTDSISVFWDSPGQGIVRLVFSNGVNQVCEKDTILPVLVLSNSYQVEKGQLYVYPNPVVDHLFVSADRPMSVWITDATGKVLKSEEVNSTEGNLDVSGLSSGLYFLRIENGRVLRFLKK